jgi:hypothetical protein
MQVRGRYLMDQVPDTSKSSATKQAAPSRLFEASGVASESIMSVATSLKHPSFEF